MSDLDAFLQDEQAVGTFLKEWRSIFNWGAKPVPMMKAIAIAADRERQLAEVRRALESLTPGGSEYVADAARCVAYVRDRRDQQHRILVNFKHRAEAAEAKVAELERQLAEAEKNLSDLRQWFVGQDDKLFAAEAKVTELERQLARGGHNEKGPELPGPVSPTRGSSPRSDST